MARWDPITLPSSSRLSYSNTSFSANGYFGLNASRPIAKGDLKWRDALLVAPCKKPAILSATRLSGSVVVLLNSAIL